MTARNDLLAEDHDLLPARPIGPRLDAPGSDDNALARLPVGRAGPVHHHAAVPDRHLDRGNTGRHRSPALTRPHQLLRGKPSSPTTCRSSTRLHRNQTLEPAPAAADGVPEVQLASIDTVENLGGHRAARLRGHGRLVATRSSAPPAAPLPPVPACAANLPGPRRRSRRSGNTATITARGLGHPDGGHRGRGRARPGAATRARRRCSSRSSRT